MEQYLWFQVVSEDSRKISSDPVGQLASAWKPAGARSHICPAQHQLAHSEWPEAWIFMSLYRLLPQTSLESVEYKQEQKDQFKSRLDYP